jgi:shikimate kinase
MNEQTRVALTGFMGVGKSSVARHLSALIGTERLDLDFFIEKNERRMISEILDSDGEAAYRAIETANLRKMLDGCRARVISLGGGTWTIEENRNLIRDHGLVSVWLESTFEHCWRNIRQSRKDRPLARNKDKALELFESREKLYCLADWHFVVRPGSTSYDVAQQIADEIFG